jgi:YidC/Oxa1 family membrane protein insertase
MEKRVLLAVFLSFLVLFIYQAAFVKQPPQKGRPAATATAKVAEPTPPGVTPTPAAGARGEEKRAEAAPPAAAPAESAAPTVVGEPAEREVVIETQDVRAVLSNRGGVLTSWRLKKFKDQHGQPLELVPQGLPASFPRPLTLRVDDPPATARLAEALYRVDVSGPVVDVTRKRTTITMEFQDAAGLRAQKEIVFQPDSYILTVNASVSEEGRPLNPTIVWGPSLGDATGGEVSRYTQRPEGILFRAGKVERLAPKTLAQQPVQEADFAFVGVDDQYFVAAALPRTTARVDYEPVAIPVPGKPGTQAELVSWGIRVAKAARDVRFFVGPKDFDVLASVSPQFTKVINFGIFSWLAVPLLRALTGINAYVHNYGWSIIILTILINVVMFPLRHKSVVSMRKMQEIQPEIKAIQDRYAKLKTTDPARQKMNTELMNLYRERGVNPASGCLPMLLTMPVLFAFYSLLSQAIEIRGAPFALWITDLSVHDPLYITPVIMGATMVWQQKITPSTVDPAQQRMMMLMPVVFTVMFLWAPSGLVLYWLVSNVLAIGQQYVTNSIIGPPAVRVVRPAAERRVRGSGGGKEGTAKCAAE